MTNKHTPGPWSVRRDEPEVALRGNKAKIFVCDENGKEIALVKRTFKTGDFVPGEGGTQGERKLSQVEETARLIAAAPDMRKAVSACLKMFMEGGTEKMANATKSEKEAFDLCLYSMAKSEGRE